MPVRGVAISHSNYGVTNTLISSGLDCQFDFVTRHSTCLVLDVTFGTGFYHLQVFSPQGSSFFTAQKLQPCNSGDTCYYSPRRMVACNQVSLGLKSLTSTAISITGIRVEWKPVCNYNGQQFSDSAGKCVDCPSGTYQDVARADPAVCKTKKVCPWGGSEGTTSTDRSCIEHICEINFSKAEKHIDLAQTIKSGTKATPYGDNSRCFLVIPDFHPTLEVDLYCTYDTESGFDFLAVSINDFAASASNIYSGNFGRRYSGKGFISTTIKSDVSGFFNLVWYTDSSGIRTGFQCRMTIRNVDTT